MNSVQKTPNDILAFWFDEITPKQLVINLCAILEGHTHGGPAPAQAANIAAVRTDTNAVKVRLDGIAETTPPV